MRLKIGRLRQCMKPIPNGFTQKRRYAENEARSLAAREQTAHAYKCMSCGSWHIGHSS